ncbi:MAG: helix-turn-helix domain-containing protein [Thiomicrospira sp.]
MNHKEIKKALNDRGYSLAAACEAMGRSYVQFYNVTNRKQKSAYIAKAIAVLIELPVETVFPEMAGDDHQSKIYKSQQVIANGKAKIDAAIEAGLISDKKSA